MNEEDGTDFWLKIDDKLLLITRDFQKRHPGGSVITHYRFALNQVNRQQLISF